MYVRVALGASEPGAQTAAGSGTPGTVELVEPEDLGRFHVLVRASRVGRVGSPELRARLAEVLEGSGVGRLVRDATGSYGNDSYIEVSALRELAGAQGVGPGWGAGLEKMVAYATSKGWTDPDGTAVQAHVEWEG